MVREKSLVGLTLVVVWAGIVGGVCLWERAHENVVPVVKNADDGDRAYLVIRPFVDLEYRVKPLEASLGHDTCDLTALAGMPVKYGLLMMYYTQALSEALQASPLTRRRYFQQAESPVRAPRYPDHAKPVYDRDVVVPFMLLPRPAAVRAWSASSGARALAWRSEDDAVQTRGSVYGRTVIFKPGKLSVNPHSFPASPLETGIPSWDLYVSDHDRSYFLVTGKVVLVPEYELSEPNLIEDRLAVLHLGEPDGATLLGEIISVPAYLQNHRLRWVSIGNGANVRRFLAYSLLDGNGARRLKISEGKWTSSKISPYVRPLVCGRHQPKIKQHDELLLPTPTGWPPNRKARGKADIDDDAHEEWCLDDWFPAQKEACWVIREAEDSKPLQESFLLMPAAEKSDRPVFFIALFAETEPKQLIEELAALYKVSPNTALNSPETMERLNSLYQQIRDFPLSK